MSLKNLNALKTHRLLFDKLKDKKTFQIYKKFENELNINENFIVAVSGGPDSLALSFLSKIYAIKKSLNIKYFIIDHKLRKESKSEAKFVKNKLKKYLINLNILSWYGKKPSKNIQSVARDKRFGLLAEKAKKFEIRNILLGHHLDDLFENFFIRILRGSGLNGLVSLDRKSQNKEVNLIRPLLNFDKKELIYISIHVFGTYIKDPSNENDKFKRVKIRKLLKQLELEGLDRNKFLLTIKNLKIANESIKFYTKKNLEENVTFLNNKKETIILSKNFFHNSSEVIFRSFLEVIKIIGKKYYPVRGKKIDQIINLIKTKATLKVTLGRCIIKKVNQTVIVSKE
ncbi:tRNA lysidine(34) synthetase TilS [Pelagibacterales bacterium SAG-MED03]|nr:tRNA lysidine(34) synthetase TilS [Pelagibacterales bacterium SAG-MED03]